MRFFRSACCLFLMAASICAGSFDEEAQRLLKDSGVKGGLVVHVGCGAGQLTGALHANDSYLVQGIAVETTAIEKARRFIRSQALYGRATVRKWNGAHLPYADNLVDLIVVSSGASVSEREIMRVLAPEGVAYVKQKNGAWKKRRKPRPGSIDEWGHYLHNVDGNQVAEDTRVAPPRHIKWQAKPYWNRQHRHGNKTAMVSAGGRLFYISNEVAPTIELLPERPFLVARDAFNGVLLWRRPIFPNQFKDRLEIPGDPDDFLLHEPAFPAEPKVVADGDALYLAFGKNGEILVLDAATGKLRKVYKGTEHTEEILCCGNFLLVISAEKPLEKWKESALTFNSLVRKRERSTLLRVLDAKDGKTIWKYNTERDGGLHVSPVIKNGAVFFIADEKLLSLDFEKGTKRWAIPLSLEEKKRTTGFRSFFYVKGPSVYDHLIAAQDVVLFVYTSGNAYSTKTLVQAFGASDGRRLWGRTCRSPERAGAAAYVVNDRVWLTAEGSGKPLKAFDLKTGQECETIDCGKVFNVGHHHRCYGNRATSRFLLTGRRGVEFIGFESGDVRLHHWLRGKCRFGVLPCNGLLYTLPHACSCYPFSTLKGYAALSGEPCGQGPDQLPKKRKEKGPAYGKVPAKHPDSAALPDWPTHRHDSERSGATSCEVPATDKKILWTTRVAGHLSSLTQAGGMLFVASSDEHSVCALESATGEVLWRFTAGGRVDSPPTVYKGYLLFGSADGYLYCLKAAGGELIWRFLAARSDRQIVANEQLESVWPVHGAVLVMNDTTYVSAGRTSLLDGGIQLYGLDVATGEVKFQNVLYDSYSDAEEAMAGNDGRNYEGEIGVLQDVLVGDGTNVYLRQLRLDRTLKLQGKSDRLVSGNGILNPAWFSRIGWYFGTPVESRHSNADPTAWEIAKASRQGQYLIFDEKRTYSVRLYPNVGKFSRYFVPGRKGYLLFADDNETGENIWKRTVPVRVEAMVVCAGKTLFVAGTPDIVDPHDPWGAIEGRKGGIMWALSAQTGAKKAQLELTSPPVFDGLIAADGRLFMSLQNGRVVCLGTQ